MFPKAAKLGGRVNYFFSFYSNRECGCAEKQKGIRTFQQYTQHKYKLSNIYLPADISQYRHESRGFMCALMKDYKYRHAHYGLLPPCSRVINRT